VASVYENLRGMLEDAIALKRPASEIAKIRAELKRFDANALEGGLTDAARGETADRDFDYDDFDLRR
jgi:hypothetical protein